MTERESVEAVIYTRHACYVFNLRHLHFNMAIVYFLDTILTNFDYFYVILT